MLGFHGNAVYIRLAIGLYSRVSVDRKSNIHTLYRSMTGAAM